MNKKGITALGIAIISFALLAVMYFFTAVLVYEAGDQYFITPLESSAKDIISDNTVASVNNTVNPQITQTAAEYRNFAFPFDFFFLVLWISLIVSTVWLAFKTNKEGIFSFFGNLFIGTLLLLLITSYVSEFVSWFISEIFDKVFFDSTVSMPIFLFYLDNLGLINFIWWTGLVIINIIDRTFISKTGEVEE